MVYLQCYTPGLQVVRGGLADQFGRGGSGGGSPLNRLTQSGQTGHNCPVVPPSISSPPISPNSWSAPVPG